jgi:hypothetical protein
MVFPIQKSVRKRNKAHLAFVASQPCLVCQRPPYDAHHLKFAQARSLGRKVSDEFTVPLCREHHQELHRHDNELAWWANLQIIPLPVPSDLWAQHRFKGVSLRKGVAAVRRQAKTYPQRSVVANVYAAVTDVIPTAARFQARVLFLPGRGWESLM